MKHIFKKFHHQPNRSNDTPQQPALPPQTTAFSDSRITSSSAASGSASAGRGGSSTATDFTIENNRLPQHQQQDYFSSEEDYQMQLALALSASSSSPAVAHIDREKVVIHCGGGTDSDNTAADLLSRRYWNYGVLDFEERVVDGFYDVYIISADPTSLVNLPSLSDLENNYGDSNYEVIIVSRKLDPALEELLQIAHCIVFDYPAPEISLLVKRLAELVIEHMGGPVRDASLILAKWMERSIEFRTSLHTTVLPIGSLKVGLLRHRALLFKVLADGVGIPCRLVKGGHYTGIEDDAVNIIKLEDESECLVDLMGDPGTLIPADVTAKDAPLKSYNPQNSNFPCIQKIKDTNASSEKLPQNWDSRNNSSLHDPSLKSKTLTPSLDSGFDNKTWIYGRADKLPATKKLDQSTLPAIGSSLHKGGIGAHTASMDSKMNPNLSYDGVDKMKVPNNYRTSNQRPATSAWKNQYALNEFSKKNGYDTMEGLNSQEDKPSEISLNSTGVTFNNSPPIKSYKVFGEREFNPPSMEVHLSSIDKESYPSENLEDSKMETERKFGEVNHTKMQGSEENMKIRVVGTSMKVKELEVSSSLGLGSNYVGTVIDEVGECEIMWENLVIGERIGLGSYGEVYHADWNDKEVAVKKFLDQDFSGAALDEFKREIRIMRRLRHPNIVLFMGAVTRPPNLSIVTEFLPRGSLYRIIHRPHCQIDENRRIKMALDVANGMNCLHTSTPTIVHRDLKSHNLLVDNDWNVKVGDFGLSRLKHNTFLSSKSTAGTPEWMAPEVLRNEPSNEKCDVYSFGVILWELATLKLPWSELNPLQVVGAVGFQNRHLEIPKEVDPLVSRIIYQCWQTDPNLRPSFAELSLALEQLQRLVLPS